jgi:repressor LexA
LDLGSLTLREIGEQIGDPHPQKIKHHLNQLFKKGLLKRDESKIVRVETKSNDQFYFIPLVGAANCGQAVTFAEENIEGYLTISHSMLNTSFRPNETFAVKAVGNSMNQALVNGESINDGDYVIVDNKQRSIEEYNNKYVLSVISGMSNIKRLVIDRLNDRIQLLSESSDSYPPIYIHEEDFGEYMVNGLVTDVVKSPKLYSGSNS